MNLLDLHAEDWTTFYAEFPSAWRFLLHTSLVREYEHLLRLTERNAWQTDRLQELKTHFAELVH